MKNRALETLLESCKGERGKSCGKKSSGNEGDDNAYTQTNYNGNYVAFPFQQWPFLGTLLSLLCFFLLFFFLVKVKSLDQKENKRLEKENCAMESCVGECRCDREYYKLGVEKLKWHSNRSIKKIEDWKVIRFELARHVRFQEK